MSYTVTQFLSVIKPHVIADMQASKILASLTAAQAVKESRYGNSGLTQKGNALFGIKATKSWTGKTVTMPTTEYYNGVKTSVNAAFRAYGSWQESIADHSAFLLRNKRYSNLIGLTDYKLACKYIKADGYATGPSYDTGLIQLIEQYNLWLWDLEALGSIAPTASFIIGRTYTLSKNMYVRKEPGGINLSIEELTEDGKAHSFADENGAVLGKGTRVTIKEIKTLSSGAIWIKIPSGWICGRGASGEVYVA